MGRLSDEPERVQWVHDRLLNLQEPHIYIVDDPNTSLPHLARNHGREAAVYLTYIVQRYDKLPDITFFWHSDEVVWHNNLLMDFNSTISINRMDRDNIVREGYVPSRCDQWPGCPTWIRYDPSLAEHRLDPHRLENMFNPAVLSHMFPAETDFPPFFAGTCCSQFAVSRDAIHRHPVDVYQHLLDWVMDTDNDDASSGRMFEYLWPYIFLGKGTHCPSMQDCYCKTYNFCLRSANDIAQMERWNNLRTRREELQWQLKFVQGALEAKQNASEADGAGPDRLLEIEEAFRPEMDRLTDSLANFTTRTWEAREAIIHYWKLGVPPVGW